MSGIGVHVAAVSSFFFFFQASATLSRKYVRNRGACSCRKQDSVIESKLIGSEHTPITLTKPV